MFFQKVLLYILHERTFLQSFVCPAATTSVSLIGIPGSLGFEAEHLSIVQWCHALLNDTTYGIGCTMQFLLSDGIGLPTVYQPKLNCT